MYGRYCYFLVCPINYHQAAMIFRPGFFADINLTKSNPLFTFSTAKMPFPILVKILSGRPLGFL